MTKQEQIDMLVKAIVHTVEYLGNDVLPAKGGWSWFDALCEVAPDEAARFVVNPIHFPTSPDSGSES